MLPETGFTGILSFKAEENPGFVIKFDVKLLKAVDHVLYLAVLRLGASSSHITDCRFFQLE